METRIAEIDTNINKQKVKVHKAHVENSNDVTTKKMLFGQLKSLKKQSARFNRLHQICSSMLEHVQEQAMMSETSTVLHEFVSVHETLIKESNLDKLVSQYQELSSNVDDIRSDLGYIGEALNSGVEDDEYNLESELDEFLKGGEEQPESTLEMTNPKTQHIVKEVPIILPDTPSIQSYFEEPEQKQNMAREKEAELN